MCDHLVSEQYKSTQRTLDLHAFGIVCARQEGGIRVIGEIKAQANCFYDLGKLSKD